MPTITTTTTTIGATLRVLRTQCGLTIEDLATRAGVNRGTIQRYEAERGDPSVYKLQALAQALGVTVGYLLDEQEPTSST